MVKESTMIAGGIIGVVLTYAVVAVVAGVIGGYAFTQGANLAGGFKTHQ